MKLKANNKGLKVCLVFPGKTTLHGLVFQTFFMSVLKKTSVQLEQYLRKHQDKKIRAILVKLNLEEIVAVINSFSRGKKKLFRLLEPSVGAEVVLHLNEYSRHKILKILTKTQIKTLVNQMDSDDLTDFIKYFPEYKLQTILDVLPEEILPEIKKLLLYDPETAGGLMQTELVALPKTLTPAQAINEVRKAKDDIENIHNLYIVDKQNKLLGSLNLDQLIFANPKETLGEIMDMNPLKVSLNVDQEKIAQIFRQHDIVSLPVTNSKGQLVGIITVDDVIDVIEQEHSEDMYKMAGVQSEEHIHDPAFLSIKRRMPWLLVNLITVFIIASVVGVFKNTIQQFAILAAYMPVVAGLGGNAATQGVTIMVRGMALGELNFAEVKGVILKEGLVGLSNGLMIGSLVGIIATLFNQNPLLGFVVGLAIWINLILAGLLGALIPFTLKKLNIDPALASSIFITAFTDSFGFFIFLTLATVIML